MPFWTYQNLANLTQGQWLVAPDDLNAELTGLWHDTREIKPGQAYLAIKGDNFDGHAFVQQAFDAGAALAIVSTKPPSLEGGAGGRVPSGPVLQVDDTIKAMQDLARAYRDELNPHGLIGLKGCVVIGIVGSNGKTTTRHMIHHVLTHAGKTGTQSQKSFNNHLGVPLTLLQARPEHNFVACEIGTNHPGEIDFLAAIARPDIAVITSIGEEHLEFFGDLDDVANEEFSICDHLQEDGVVIAGLGPYDELLQDRIDDRHEFYTTYECDPPQSMPLLGIHNRSNASAAIMVADLFGVLESECHEALCSIQPEAHRGEMIAFGSDVLIFDDCYNANPSSMRAAIETLLTIDRPGRHVAILGDMFELGDQADELHEAVARYAIERTATILIGERFSKLATSIDEVCTCFAWTDRTPGDIAALLQPGDTVLLKASRGMRLERLIPAIERRFGPAQGDEPT